MVHVTEKLAMTWLGSVGDTKSAWWQPSHVVWTVLYGVVVWHWVHWTTVVLCTPVSAIGAVGWLNVAPVQLATTWWQEAQSVPYPAEVWFGLVVAT